MKQNKPFLPADMAHKLSAMAEERRHEQEMTKIAVEIDKAIQAGQYSITYSVVTERTFLELRRLGYRCSQHEKYIGARKPAYFTIISWK